MLYVNFISIKEKCKKKSQVAALPKIIAIIITNSASFA